RLLESIVQLCKVLGMRTVAEGVETAQQLATLQAMGVDEYQGYHFARPMPVDEWLALLRGGAGQLPLLPRLPAPSAAAAATGSAAGGVLS
ncbi:MAG TPA: EAL domain-containing protein, partial [Aquabacterium sp.]|nr:EAL domain-containing protein [Aquabacterium sp.]